MADRGVHNIKAFGWGDQAGDVLAALKDPHASFYLVLIDVNGTEVSIEIPTRRGDGLVLRSNDATGQVTIDGLKLPVVAVEVEVEGEPEYRLLKAGTAVMQINSKPIDRFSRDHV